MRATAHPARAMATDGNTTKVESPPARRVLICFGPTGLDRPALQVAAGLAAGLRATLAGLYVEDEQLQRVAALPFTQELNLLSARIGGFSTEDLQRAQRQQTVQLRRLLAALAEPLSLAWTIDVVRGDFRAIVEQAASANDLLVLARPQFAPPPISGPDARELHPAGLARHTIGVLDDASPSAQRALSAALALKRASGNELVILIAAGDATSFTARCTELRHQLGGVRARLQRIDSGDRNTAVKSALAWGATALILPHAIGAQYSPEKKTPAETTCLQILVS